VLGDDSDMQSPVSPLRSRSSLGAAPRTRRPLRQVGITELAGQVLAA